MAEYPALPLFTDAYLADTRHLTAAQHGAYLLLMITAWRHPDCALPDQDEKLARWASMDIRTWQKHKVAIMAFWKLGDDHKWRQGRLLDERHYVENRRSKNADAGKASALKRKERGSTSVQRQRNQNPTPSLSPTPTPSEAKASSAPYPLAFETFWTTYPKNGASKVDALASWQKAIRIAPPETIVNAVPAYVGYLQATETPVAHATTWLNGQRWTVDHAALASLKSPPKRKTHGEIERESKSNVVTLGGQP